MRKVAATILALALATTHGLLEEGGPNVQKKDAIKEGYPGYPVKAGSSRVREGRVGRKLDFGISTLPPATTPVVDTPAPTTPQPTPYPTPQPTPCPKKLDVCIAVDESGSICSTIDDQPELCEDGDCDEVVVIGGVPITTCDGPPSTICDYESGCSKFNVDTKVFAAELINALSTDSELDELQVSVVEYGTQGILTSGLTTPDLATTAVNGIVYSGGYTNLEQAIEECQKTLEASTAGETAVVIIGDGNPTAIVDSPFRCTDGNAGSPVCKEAAAAAATAAKYTGIDIATVFIETVYDPMPDKDFLEDEIASEGLGFTPPNFPTAQALADALVERVECSSN